MEVSEIHALIIGDASNPKVIQMSQRFEILLDISRRTVEVKENDSRPKFFEHRVKSLHTLYGENGCGKTELLLQIASTFVRTKKAQRVGVLFSVGNSLQLYRGQPLGRWNVVPQPIKLQLAKAAPPASAVFYSTSPFEIRRRAGLANSPVLDVSPPFSKELSFDGFALLDSFTHLQDKAPFLEKLRISVKARLPSADSMIQRVMALFEDEKFPGFHPRTMRLQIRTWLSEMAPDMAEVTLLNILLITSAPASGPHNTSVAFYFAQSLTNFLGRVSEQPEYEGLGVKFAELCEDFLAGFPKVFPIHGVQLWRYLRGNGSLLSTKTKTELFGTPSEISKNISLETNNARTFAVTLGELGLLQFRVKNLSSGETAFLMLYASLASALSVLEKDQSNEPVFLLLDEGEMFLHPSWQRQYIGNVLDFISKFPQVSARVHLFMTTHSLIVAADAPPNTLFDVNAGETRNGFGLGPGAVLSDVYHVERFAGTNAGALIDKLIEYLKNPVAQSTETVRALTEVLADSELQRYVQRELDRRAGVQP